MTQDTIWVSSSEQGADQFNDADSFDNSPDNFYDDDDDDDNHYHSDFVDENAAPNSANGQTSNGLAIHVAGGLLEAPRKVNKLDIGYVIQCPLASITPYLTRILCSHFYQ